MRRKLLDRVSTGRITHRPSLRLELGAIVPRLRAISAMRAAVDRGVFLR